MSLARLDGSESDSDALAPAVAALEELIADFGARGVAEAFLRTTAGDQLSKFGSNATLRAIQFVVREIVFSENARLAAEVVAMASGMILEEGMSVTKLAARHGVGKAAVSKRMVNFCRTHGLPPSIYMRPEKDREIYRTYNRPKRS
ncbi:MAG: hypothetical protein WCA95_05105 [Opitutaceae bacterium]